MVTFSVPCKDDKRFINFKIESGSVLFAGSRHITLPDQVCTDLIGSLGSLGLTFITGCANGVDASFRRALAGSDYAESSTVACAFKERAQKLRGLYPLYVVPSGLPPRTALARRTLWMTNKCSMLILFPSDPIGKGSNLAFKSTIMQSKPVFIVPPDNIRRLQDTDILKDNDIYTVYSSNLFGIVDGWWCLPPIYEESGLCYEPV